MKPGCIEMKGDDAFTNYYTYCHIGHVWVSAAFTLSVNDLADFSRKGSCETSKELEDRVGTHRLGIK